MAWPVTTAAACLGVSVRTLRYYEELGLIRPDRTPGNARVYDSRSMARAEWIIDLRRAGLAPAEIILLDALDAHEARDRLQARLASRMADLEAKCALVRRILSGQDSLPVANQTRSREAHNGAGGGA